MLFKNIGLTLQNLGCFFFFFFVNETHSLRFFRGESSESSIRQCVTKETRCSTWTSSGDIVRFASLDIQVMVPARTEPAVSVIQRDLLRMCNYHDLTFI